VEQLTANQVTSESIDHLGLVAATIHNVGLISLIDEILPINSKKGSNISMGQRVAGMILNGLGFVDNRLYMFPEFLSNKPIGRLLLDDNVSHNHFNDDALGRCLDAIHLHGVESFFAKLAYPIALNQGLLGDSMHVDTTSLTLQGAYDFTSDEIDTFTQPINESLPTAEINYGHSKDHRPDLKQIVLAMATTGAAGFPIWMEVHSGNASDQKTLHEASVRMDSFIKDFDDKDRKLIYVADSAAYSACVNQTDNHILTHKFDK
jgi:transposase